MQIIKGHWQLILITVAVFALWRTPAVLPLKILIVFFHEIAHGLAALVTGGSIDSINLHANQGGVTLTRGGNVLAIVSAGYLGSLLIGIFLFVAAVRSRLDRGVMAALGGVLLAITGLYARDSFVVLFGLGTGVAMMLAAWKLPAVVNDLGLRVIGLTSMIYVPYDIVSDTLLRPDRQSDAYNLAQLTFGSGKMWGVIWLLFSLLVIGACLRFGLGRRSNFTRPEHGQP
jgi:hypothetical protein